MKHQSKIITIVFLAFLAALSLTGILLPPMGFSEAENRFLQKKPVFTWKAFTGGVYGKEYEDYLSDQFPGRNYWVTLKTNIELALGKQDVGGVYFGKDGYYMEKFDASHIQTERLTKNLNYVKQFSDQMAGILPDGQVKIMLVPSAAQILEDKLPPFASPFDQSLVTDQLKYLVGVEKVVDLEEKLKSHKNEELYYRTDHHWTTLGAYYGYSTWAKDMGLLPWDMDEFYKINISTDFLGTIQSKVNISMKKDVIQLFVPAKEAQYQVFYDGEKTSHNSFYNLDALQKKDQYSVFLDGNHGWTQIKNCGSSLEGEGKKLLIIKDSYANCFAPFAANHYEEVNLLDLRYFNQDVKTFVIQQNITDILLLYQIPGFSKDRNLVKLK